MPPAAAAPNDEDITITPRRPIFNQRRWRIVGGAAIGGCALMAWYGTETIELGQSVFFLLGYWVLFLLFLLVALYVVLLDLRYIRLQYKLGQREIFLKTLGSEEFRRALRRAHQREQPPDGKPD